MSRARLIMAACSMSLALGAATARAQGVAITPGNEGELQTVLEGLAKRHEVSRWCAGPCATIYAVRLSGRLERGALDFEVRGAVAGERKAFVELFALGPVLGLGEARDGAGRAAPLYWTGEAYAAVLDGGDFVLRGQARFEPGASLTFKVPGPAGHVVLAVDDAEIAGTGERRGVTAATYQLAPAVRDPGLGAAAAARLRLEIERSFELAREKTFGVTIRARGARPGQIIPITLAAGESVEGFDENAGRLRIEGADRRIEWVADGPEATLSYSGKWAAERIALTGPAGSVRETWRVRCDDPYDCAFGGDAEPVPGANERVWAPLPGQRLEVTWRELAPLAGVHTVAQTVVIASRPVGRNLEQKVQIDWRSSSGSLVALELPARALVSRFELDGKAMPMLKDERGALRVALPSGTSRLLIDWEIADAGVSLLRPPVPTLSAAVGSLWHDVRPPAGRQPLLVGGMAGAPRVELWPNLGACLVVMIVVGWLARWAGQPVASAPLWAVSAAGFAIASPAALVPLVLVLGVSRWLARIDAPRSRARIVLELGAVLGLVLLALGGIFATLDHALLDAHPIAVGSFVAPPEVAGLGWSSQRLAWGAYLAGRGGEAVSLPAPWVLMVPLVLLRFVWAAWAVALALFLVREGRGALAALGRYWEAAGWRAASQLSERSRPRETRE